jgi:hypothetical protein
MEEIQQGNHRNQECLRETMKAGEGSHAETRERERELDEVTNPCQEEEVPLTQNEMAE